MADITVRNQGEVEDSGKVNWRGDQQTVPNEQSIYKSSAVQLADLGARKVVGDRVFRYAKCLTGLGAGELGEAKMTLLEATGGGTDAAGGKTFSFYGAAAIAKDTYAEGYLNVVTEGNMYRIKNNDAVSSAGNGTFYLYDPLQTLEDITAEYSIVQNPYLAVEQCTTGAATVAIGVAPIDVTTGDYFWLQTWGPANMKCGEAAKGDMIVADVTGQCIAFDNSSAGVEIPILGHTLMDVTASQYGFVFVQIAP